MRKIVFLVTEDRHFLSHYKTLAETCMKAGWQVVVACHVLNHGAEITAMGCALEPVSFAPGSSSLWRDLKTLLRIVVLLRRQKPDLLHSVGAQPVLYGAIAAALSGVKATVSTTDPLSPNPAASSALPGAILRCGLRRRGSAALSPFPDSSLVAEQHLRLYDSLVPTTPLVLHLITGLGSGGAERQLALLLKEPNFHNGLRHLVVSMTNLGRYGQELRDAGIAVHCLGMRRGIPTPGGFFRLWQLMRRTQPAIVQTWLYHADLLGLVAARLSGWAKVAWNLRCSDMDMRRYSFLSRLILQLLAKLSRFPAVILHNSQAGRRAHEALGYAPRRWQLMPNGFDLTAFAPDPMATSRLRDSLGLPPQTVLVGMVARYDAMKDHATFLKAAGLVAAQRPDVAFLLAGSGVEDGNAALSELVQSCGLVGRVHLLGQRDDIQAITPGFNLAVLSSAFGEGFPNALGEAQACGVPCVATDVGDSALVLGEQGRIVPPGQPETLAAAVLAMLNLPLDDLRQLGADARLRMERDFSMPALATRYAAFYAGLVEKG